MPETSYSVGARLAVKDEATSSFEKFFQKLKQLETSTKSVQKLFDALDKTAFGGVMGRVGELIDKMKLVDTQAKLTSEAVKQSFLGSDAAIRGTISEAKLLTGEFKAAETAARSIGRVRPGMGNNSGGGEIEWIGKALVRLETPLGRVEAKAVSAGGTLAGSFDALTERLGRRMSEAAGAARAVHAGQSGGKPHQHEDEEHHRDRRAPHEHEHESHARPTLRRGSRADGNHGSGRNTYGEQVEVGMNLGMMGTMGFGEVSEVMKSTLEHAFELMHVQQQMKMAGIGDADVMKATSEAWKESAASGQSVVKVMEDIKELTFPLGNVEHAIAFTNQLEKMRVVLNAVTEGSGNSSKNAVYEMARAGELKGLQTPEEFSSYFDNMTKVISASGGKVTPKDFMQAMKYGRVASLGWDEEFTTKYLPTLMQSLGPTGAGTASMSLFGTLIQGKVGQKAFHQMDDLGLIADRKKLEFDKAGNPVGFQPGAIVGSDLLTKNPALWAQQVLLPLIEKKFGDINDPKNKTDVVQNLGGMFGNRMSAQAIAEFVLRIKSIDKDVNLLKPAYGTNGAEGLLNSDPNTIIAKLGTSFGNLLTAIGGPSGKNAIEIMNGLAGSINNLTSFFNAHPAAGKLFMEGALALAIGLSSLAAYGAALAAAGDESMIALSALAMALMDLACPWWDEVIIVAGAIGGFIGQLESILSDALKWLPSLPAGSTDAPLALPSAEQGLMQLNAYHTDLDESPTLGGVSDASRALEDAVYRGTLHALTAYGQGTPAGLSNASYGGGGGGGGGGGRSHGAGAPTLPAAADPVRRASALVAAADGDRARTAAQMVEAILRTEPRPGLTAGAAETSRSAVYDAVKLHRPGAPSVIQRAAIQRMVNTRGKGAMRFGPMGAHARVQGASQPANDDEQPREGDVLHIDLMVEGKVIGRARYAVPNMPQPNARVVGKLTDAA